MDNFDGFQVVKGLCFDLRSVIRSISRLFVSLPQLSDPCGHQPAILIDKVTGLRMELAAQRECACYLNRQGNHSRTHKALGNWRLLSV